MPGIAGTLAYDPSQLAGLNAGANLSGSNNTGLTGGVTGSGTISPLGGTSNPFTTPPSTAGTSTPGLTSPYSSPYDTSGATSAVAGLGPGAGGTNPGTGSGAFGFTGSDLASSIQASGVKGGAGTALADFLNTGAGYSPQVAQALIAAMQPQIAAGRANTMEQFGATGQADSSVAALGLADYNSQTNLAVGQLLSGLYEQSVQNYMQTLTAMKNTPRQPFWEELLNTAVGALKV